MKKIVVLTGAGVSAESGIKTFRDANGLWEEHNIMEVASPQGWQKNKELVLDFYNKRRSQLKEVQPNPAHFALKKLEERYEVQIITQNIDDLHERAGSRNVIHLHGELKKARSTFDETLILDWEDDLCIGDFCGNNSQLRPHVVWFGEPVPLMEKAMEITSGADILIVIGTSLQVYPAAALMDFVQPGTKIYFIDPAPSILKSENLEIIAEKASIGVPRLAEKLLRASPAPPKEGC
ncbi:MAG TPA: NAD-dependent deacylase [Salinimicrobium sp.]|nr:NAD-dependent deacylase [Salinimicrobium sp.]